MLDKTTSMKKFDIERIFSDKSLHLFRRYEGVRTKLEPELARINAPYYSEHGLVHCDNILKNIDLIVPYNIKCRMGENELFCLFCSILLHDIGRIKQKEPYESFKETNKDHARRSFDWVMENGEEMLGLDRVYIEPIAWICLGHGDVAGAEDEIKNARNDCMIPIDNERMDILFLISLLRLGDVLDIGFRRVPTIAITSLWNLPPGEIKFILKDYLTDAVIIDSKGWIIEVTLKKPSNIGGTIFSDIETNLIRNKCNEVLESVMEHLKRRDVFFRSIDVKTIKSGPVKALGKLLEKERTEETFKEMAEEYEKIPSELGNTYGCENDIVSLEQNEEVADECEKVTSYEETGEIILISIKPIDKKKKRRRGTSIDVIVLAGGYAKRLWPLTQIKPKPLLKINGKEILSYILDELNNFANVNRVYVSTNKEFKEHFIDFFNRNAYPNMTIELIIEPHANYSERLGPIGGLEYIREVKGASDYMVIAGDNIFEYNLSDFFNFYMKHNKSIIALQLPPHLRDMSQFGIVEVDETGAIKDFDEKPKWPANKFISTGCYVLPQEDFDLVSDYIEVGKDVDSLGKFMKWLAEDEECGILGYIFKGEWFDVGTLDTLLLANQHYLKPGNLGNMVGNVEIKNNVYIDEGTRIVDSEIGPNVYVGKNCKIADSKISDALIYDNVKIEEGTIQHSVIDEGSNVAGKISGIIAR